MFAPVVLRDLRGFSFRFWPRCHHNDAFYGRRLLLLIFAPQGINLIAGS
jgi:hypothetical protein